MCEVGLPILPTSFPGNGSCRQLSSMKGCIRKAEITRVTVLQFRWKTAHDCCEGKGNVELNSVSNLSSVPHRHAGFLPNDREGMSAMVLRFPAMGIGINGHAFCCFARKARAWMRFSTTVERFDANLFAHPIVGELSLKRVRRFSLRGPQMSSMVSHRRTRPAISKSEFIMRLPGFWAVLISFAMSGGHFHQKIVGTHGESSPIMTPPAPWPEASTSYIIRPPRNQLLAACWFFCRLSEECSASLNGCKVSTLLFRLR